MHIKKGKLFMKVLKIVNGRCYFSTDGTTDKPISDIGKDDLLKILDMIYLEQEYEIDPIDSSTVIHNDVEKIIYESVYHKIKDFISKVQELRLEVENEFKEAKEKYIS